MSLDQNAALACSFEQIVRRPLIDAHRSSQSSRYDCDTQDAATVQLVEKRVDATARRERAE